MQTTRFKPSPCPHGCGYAPDAASPADPEDDSTPHAGDVSLCFGCGEWCVFADDAGTLRRPTDDEMVEIGLDAECRKVRRAWVQFRRSREPSR